LDTTGDYVEGGWYTGILLPANGNQVLFNQHDKTERAPSYEHDGIVVEHSAPWRYQTMEELLPAVAKRILMSRDRQSFQMPADVFTESLDRGVPPGPFLPQRLNQNTVDIAFQPVFVSAPAGLRLVAVRWYLRYL